LWRAETFADQAADGSAGSQEEDQSGAGRKFLSINGVDVQPQASGQDQSVFECILIIEEKPAFASVPLTNGVTIALAAQISEISTGCQLIVLPAEKGVFQDGSINRIP